MPSVLIVDDHSPFRTAVRQLLERGGFRVVGEAADGQEAFEKIQQQPVDVALVDIRMPRADGFQFLQLLREAGMALPVVLMHSVDDGSKSLSLCREMGARGLVSKGQDKEGLLDAVRHVHAGDEVWSGSIPCRSR